MKVKVNKITGFEDAFAAMYISKRSWTQELDADIRKTCNMVLDEDGRIKDNCSSENLDKFNKWLAMLLRMGKRHITLLRYIDISIMTEGLHRAGQDDVDAHARRFDNRIIRNSTRLATFDQDEFSDYYKDRVVTTDKMMKNLKINVPLKVYEDKDGNFYTEDIEYLSKDVIHTWVKTPNGYILEEYKDDKDVKRGLYMLGIPSNFLSKINLCEYGHVFKERNKDGGANPEVKDWAEEVMKQITEFHSMITRDFVLSIEN